MFGSPQENLSDSAPSTLESSAAKPTAKATGRWTKEEHQRFIEGLKKFGKNWKQVEDYVGTRSGAQIRSHAQKFFNRLEREYNFRIDGSKSQISQQITESLRKMSEASGSTNLSILTEGINEDSKMEEANPSVTSTNSKEIQLVQLQPADCEKPGSRNLFLEETQSVPPDKEKGPKLAPLSEGVSSFRRNMRKMSEDVITKHSMSMFEVIMSKIRTSKNGIDFPKLSDLVDVGLGTSYRSTTNYKLFNKENQMSPETRDNLVNNPSFRVNPRKISEDNIILIANAEVVRKASCDDLNEFELFNKKVKKE